MHVIAMEDLSLHILDIAENALAAGACNLAITVHEDHEGDLLAIEIADDGRGMRADDAARAADPFYTTRTTRRVGLGLSLLREAAEAAGGSMEIHSEPGRGTKVRATFQLSHIDCKPLGSMAETIMALLTTERPIDVRYVHICNGRKFTFDTKEIRGELHSLARNSMRALRLMREHLREEEDTLSS